MGYHSAQLGHRVASTDEEQRLCASGKPSPG